MVAGLAQRAARHHRRTVLAQDPRAAEIDEVHERLFEFPDDTGVQSRPHQAPHPDPGRATALLRALLVLSNFEVNR
jgi:hypothetical protein